MSDLNNGEEKHFSGLIFVACMFIGAGIGLIFGRPDVGGCLGMGIGFLLMGLIRAKKIQPPPTIEMPKTAPKVASLGVGALFILIGFVLIFYPQIPWQYLAGMILVLVGFLAIFAGFLKATK